MMQENYARLGLLLTIGCLIGILGVVPYSLHLQGSLLDEYDLPIPFWLLIFLQVIQNMVLFAVLSFAGLYIANRTGFELPVLEKMVSKKPWLDLYKKHVFSAALLGIGAALLIVLLDFLVFAPLISTEVSSPVDRPSWWMGLLASFYGAINEEVLARLFLIPLIVFVFQFALKKKKDEASDFTVWTAIVLSSLLFGLAHLPITIASGAPLNLIITMRALVLNSVAAIPFGWLFWRRGLIFAMSSHFSADFVLHVMLPLFFMFF